MEATWIVTANTGRARIFADAKGADKLEEINDMVNDAVRLRTQDTETDRLGPTSATQSIHNTGGATPNKQYEPHQTPAEHQSELFARSLCDYLLQGHQQNRYNRLTLAAAPQFLGLLRKMLDPQVSKLVTVELDKDYTQVPPHQLREQIAAHQQKA